MRCGMEHPLDCAVFGGFCRRPSRRHGGVTYHTRGSPSSPRLRVGTAWRGPAWSGVAWRGVAWSGVARPVDWVSAPDERADSGILMPPAVDSPKRCVRGYDGPFLIDETNTTLHQIRFPYRRRLERRTNDAVTCAGPPTNLLDVYKLMLGYFFLKSPEI